MRWPRHVQVLVSGSTWHRVGYGWRIVRRDAGSFARRALSCSSWFPDRRSILLGTRTRTRLRLDRSIVQVHRWLWTWDTRAWRSIPATWRTRNLSVSSIRLSSSLRYVSFRFVSRRTTQARSRDPTVSPVHLGHRHHHRMWPSYVGFVSYPFRSTCDARASTTSFPSLRANVSSFETRAHPSSSSSTSPSSSSSSVVAANVRTTEDKTHPFSTYTPHLRGRVEGRKNGCV